MRRHSRRGFEVSSSSSEASPKAPFVAIRRHRAAHLLRTRVATVAHGLVMIKHRASSPWSSRHEEAARGASAYVGY